MRAKTMQGITLNKRRSSPVLVFLEVLMLALSLVMLIPMAFAVLQSVKSPAEASKLDFSLPSELHFENFTTAIEQGNLWNALKLSALITGLTLVLTIVVSSLAAYVISRKSTTLTRFWYLFLVLGMIPPAYPIPTVRLMQLLGLQGNPLALVFFYAAIFTPFSVFLMVGFLRGVPRELDEAAFIDGCSPWSAYWRIIFPTIKPVIFTNVIFIFMWAWNDFQWPLYMLSGGTTNSTLPLSAFEFISKYGTSWELMYADLIMVCLPVVILYIFARKYIVEGMVAGAVKG